MPLPPLTPEDLDALHVFAQQHGRTWKSQLLRLWEKAAAPPLLHALRNSHEPSWLVRFRLHSTMVRRQ